MGRYIAGSADLTPTMEEVLRDVNERVSSFLREERNLKGRSIRTVARKLKIKRRHIKAWEDGRKSPPVRIMLQIAALYGRKASSRGQNLVQSILDEKSARDQLMAWLKANPPKKLPAVIWAEKDQIKRAA